MAEEVNEAVDTIEVIKAMKKARKSVKTFLARGGFSIGKHYRITPAGNNPEFTINVIQAGKGGLGTSLTRIESIIKKELYGEIITVPVTPKSFKIKFINYESTEEETDPETTIPPSLDETKEEEKRDVGRPMTEFGIFRDNLINFIHKETNARLDKGTKGFWITTPLPKDQEDHRWVLIHCPGPWIMFDVVRALENNPYYLNRLTLNVAGNTIRISDKENPSVEEKFSFVKNFFEHLTFFAEKSDGFKKIQTPMMIVASEDPAKIDIEFESSNEAYTFMQKINKSWSPAKEGSIITTNVSKKQMLEFIKDGNKASEEDRKIGLITKTRDESINSYVQMSTNYKDFHFLSFNRKRKKRKIMKLVESMKKWGVCSFPTIAKTDCIDGKMKMWIIDGQHRFDAMVYLGLPILYTEVKVHSKEEAVLLIADLNSNSQNWSLRDYLNAFCEISEEYRTIHKNLNDTKLPITVILEIFSGMRRDSASQLFQIGKFRIGDIEKSERQVSQLIEVRRLIPKSREILSAMVLFINRENYENERMKNALKNNKAIQFIPGEGQDNILKKLELIYNQAA